MNRRTLIAGAIAATAPIALIAAAPAVAGLPPVDYGMRITVTGPGMVVTGSLSLANVTNFGLFNDEPTITLTPSPEGNYAEFMGWTGACASAGQGPCTITLVPDRSTECLWAGARFERPGEPVAVPVDPCTTPGGGGSGGGAGTREEAVAHPRLCPRPARCWRAGPPWCAGRLRCAGRVRRCAPPGCDRPEHCRPAPRRWCSRSCWWGSPVSPQPDGAASSGRRRPTHASAPRPRGAGGFSPRRARVPRWWARPPRSCG